MTKMYKYGRWDKSLLQWWSSSIPTAEWAIEIIHTVYSIYHPVEYDEQKLFNDELDIFYANALQNSEILAGQDINANVGIASPMINEVLGPNVIMNRNVKGKDMLFLIKSQKLKLLLSYFTHKCYTTRKSLAVGN